MKKKRGNLPIGVFDSGIGGLTVLRTLAQQLPHESFLFLGDTARLPYGSKSPDTIRAYLLQNIEYLKSQGVKAIVVACNSASSVLRSDDQFGLPVLSVIRPGAEKALSATDNFRIGVLGTTATINRRAYEHAIKKLRPKTRVFQQACPLLVPLVEEGWTNHRITTEIVKTYARKLKKEKVDTVILGCTHYPVLKKQFVKVFGKKIHLVDPSIAVADELTEMLQSNLILPNSNRRRIRIQVTDNSSTFRTIAARILAPQPIHELEHVHI